MSSNTTSRSTTPCASFLGSDFLLSTPLAATLFHEYAAELPIIDYHTHLDAGDIAQDRRFTSITQAWLAHDHYKWRLMRQNSTNEELCTGKADERKKFKAFAAAISYAPGNPLYTWAHLELKRYFGLNTLLSEKTADAIFDRTGELLQTPDFSARQLLSRMRVAMLCTTDDPCDDLKYHRSVADQGLSTKVLPAFRPDKLCRGNDAKAFTAYLDRLADSSGIAINRFDDIIAALGRRHAVFAAHGCVSSDHSLEPARYAEATPAQLQSAFEKIRCDQEVTDLDWAKVHTAILLAIAQLNAAAGWVMQLHVGATRNLSTRLRSTIGPDAGADAIGEAPIVAPLAHLIDAMQQRQAMPRLIVYNLNPSQNAAVATMLGCFASGPIPGMVQYGPAWWFNDHTGGIRRQLQDLGALGALGRFVGMVTDSRSLFSYPRHEYFRRILCDELGLLVQSGELPSDMEMLSGLVRDICYNNAAAFFSGSAKEQ